MSVDGFIALPDDSVGHLFDWYESSEVALPWPGMGMVSHVTPASARYLREAIEGTGAIVVGRRVYDYTNGWAARTSPWPGPASSSRRSTSGWSTRSPSTWRRC
jgi:hypothetical protein